MKPMQKFLLGRTKAGLIIACVLCLPALVWGANSPILERAARGIETCRKAGVVVRVVRKDGSAVANARIEVSQRTHDFAFGNVFRPRFYNNEQYRARFLEIFNFVQLLEFNWGQYETQEGKPRLAERMDFINGWCREHGLSRFYGHMLVWSRQEDEPDGPEIPHWLFRYDRATQDRLLKERIQREVRAYRDVDIVWDVVNEAIHCRTWGAWDKPGYIDEPLAEITSYVHDSFQWAREADPRAKLLLNDYRVVAQNKYRDRYIELIHRLQKERTPLDAIGIQAHEPFKGAYWFSPEEIWAACEEFGTGTGLPLYFSEFAYTSDTNKVIRGTYREGKWSPEKQAEAVEEFYRVAFGHPAVQAIIYFGLSESTAPALPDWCLLDKNFQPKPAWRRLTKLIKEEWNTRQTGFTDATGSYRFRGFFGRYRIRISEAGRPRSFTAHLVKDHPNKWSFVLDE